MVDGEHPVVIVTGGTAGIGRAAVREFAARGYDVAVLARGTDGLDAAVADVEKEGRRGLAVPTDVADAAAVDGAARRVEAELGPIAVWVNNAFTGSITFFEDLAPDEFRRITEVTYLGFVNGTRAALRHMVPRGQGVIIQVGSALAFRGLPLQAAYSGAKHAIVGFTEAVRTELRYRRSPVRLCEVHLPGVNTPQFDEVLHRGVAHQPRPVAPVYQPEVAARAIAEVARRPRRSTWVGASTVATILANRMAPWLLDRYLARTAVPGQEDPAHDPPSSRTNTWQPPAGDLGAHGEFDDEAHAHSPQAWLTRHRAVALVGGLALAAGAGAAALRVPAPRRPFASRGSVRRRSRRGW
ncbi:short-subunit dehydrogenase [Pseudonocardia hierapolitana]|uniref:Short-subunit dehydrogenase n=1 Tax=Pseudonocardia hierapolitana TaxID=1128676 RepID=A0A561T4E5_9PSEU|nr:SDR family oxidoreductase [Pseudonocardia hierapolitana]TWF81990.1 short-subunit dehydrogenase [Pseudonocardia hierapolitana]